MRNKNGSDKDVCGNGYLAKLSLPSEKDGDCLSASLPGHFTLRERDPVATRYDENNSPRNEDSLLQLGNPNMSIESSSPYRVYYTG